jgi:hypothetical protein
MTSSCPNVGNIVFDSTAFDWTTARGSRLFKTQLPKSSCHQKTHNKTANRPLRPMRWPLSKEQQNCCQLSSKQVAKNQPQYTFCFFQDPTHWGPPSQGDIGEGSDSDLALRDRNVPTRHIAYMPVSISWLPIKPQSQDW